MADSLDSLVAELLAKQAIREVVLRYCRGVDRMDRELVRACFHDDAQDHHGNFQGGVDELLDWMWPLLAKYDHTMHLVGNLLIELRGDAARAETYGIAFHRGDPQKARRNLVSGFRYIDRFERRSNEWRIARRTVTTEWTRVDAPEHWWTIGDDFLRGSRGPDDPVYEPLG
jgi:hypothetical protein